MEAANSQSKFRTMNGQKNRICRGPPEADEWKRVTLDCKLSDMGSINTSAFGLIVVCFGRFWVRDLSFPNARHLGHPFQWKNTLPWHLGPAAKVRILRFKDVSPFRHYRGLQNHVWGIHQGWPRQLS